MYDIREFTKDKPPTREQRARRIAERQRKEDEWYSLCSLLGINWAMLFALLGGRETGKSYAVMDLFLDKWKQKGNPFFWLRLNEASQKKMLVNNAQNMIDADLRRKYDLDLAVKGNHVYDHGKLMCTMLSLSTFANDKGVALFDKDYLKNHPDWYYHIALDEFQLEKTQRSQGDIAYQFIQQLENLIRSTKERCRIFLIGNTLEEASDILTMLDFIPEQFGRYKLKRKRAVIDYMEPSEAYKKRRAGTLQDILAGDHSNFTNKIQLDKSLVTTRQLVRPTAIIHFDKATRFTVWDGCVISTWNREKCKVNIAMRPYQDIVFDAGTRDAVILKFDSREFLFKNLISFKKFQKELQLIKPRKQ